jgi:NAD(P)-dependent dehydrogenase (short-subunit alcohol dehydrogenase family)
LEFRFTFFLETEAVLDIFKFELSISIFQFQNYLDLSIKDTTMAALNPPLSTPHLDVTGRVFVITGGTQGLGMAVARVLKGNGAAGLVLVSRSPDKGKLACDELSSQHCKCVWIKADLTQSEEASAIIPRAVEAMKDVGEITGVVNGAATTARGNLMTTTAADFDLQMAVNVRAPFLITQAAAKVMTSGSIVNIASVAAHGGAPFIMAYSVAKAALVALTKNNAAELPHIRVNAINMGWCLTDNEDVLQKTEHEAGSDWAQHADASVPLGRILRPQDVAATVAFLLSDASALMTGAILELHPEYADGILSRSATARER